jgi:hypothetical protein
VGELFEAVGVALVDADRVADVAAVVGVTAGTATFLASARLTR